MLLVTLAVGVTLGSAYLLTESLITDEVDLIIDTELKSLRGEVRAQRRSPGVTDEINLRIDSWGRIGAVYMLADPNFERIAGNVTDWPFDGMPTERWPEFEIGTIEPGRRAVHPVRAAVRTLPGRGPAAGRHRHLPGAALRGQVPHRHPLGHRAVDARGRARRLLVQLPPGAPRRGGRQHLRAHPRRGARAAAAGRPAARDEFDSLAVSVNHVLDRLEEQAGTLRATFDSAAHDLRAPLHRLRTRMDALLLRSPPLEPAGARVGGVGAARSRSPAAHARDAAADRARRIGRAARLGRRRGRGGAGRGAGASCSSRSPPRRA